MLVVYTLVVVIVDQNSLALLQVDGNKDTGTTAEDENGITVVDAKVIVGGGNTEVLDGVDEDEMDGRDEDEMDGVDVGGEEGDDELEVNVDDKDGERLVLVMTLSEIELCESEIEALGIGVDGKSEFEVVGVIATEDLGPGGLDIVVVDDASGVLDGCGVDGASDDVGDTGKFVVPSAAVLVVSVDVCGGGSVSDGVGPELDVKVVLGGVDVCGGGSASDEVGSELDGKVEEPPRLNADVTKDEIEDEKDTVETDKRFKCDETDRRFRCDDANCDV
jgi:hypothetical protein